MNNINQKKNLSFQRIDANTFATGGGGRTSGTNSDLLFEDTSGFGVNSSGVDGFVKETYKNTVEKFNKKGNVLTQMKDTLKSKLDSIKKPETLEAEKEKKMDALKAEIEAATEAYEKLAESLNAELEEIKAEAEEYENQLAEIEEEIAEIDEQVNENDNQISEKDAQISEKDDAIAEKDSAIADKDAQISDISEQMSSIGDEISGLNNQISSLQSQLSSLTSTGDEEADAANAAKRSELQNQISQLEAQKSEKEQQKTSLEDKKSALEAEKDQLKAEKEELKAQKEELQAQKDELKAKNEELKAKKEPLEAEKTKIEEQKAALEEKQAQVEQKIEENENSDNKKLMDEGQAKIQALEQEYNEKIEAAKEREANKLQKLESNQNNIFAEKVDDTAQLADKIKETIEEKGEFKGKTLPEGTTDLYNNTFKPLDVSIYEEMHTEFGMDKDGDIEFQEAETQKVYDKLVEQTIDMLSENGELDALGGKEAVEKIVQSGWIATYDSIQELDGKGSSASHYISDFLFDASENICKMIEKAKSDPQVLEALTQRTSYADNSLTDGLKHYNTNTTYGGDEKINYKGDVIQYEDGSVHINDTNDDRDYQATMDQLLERVIEKYPGLDKSEITELFRNAQMGAIYAMQGNASDCPYGTGNNNQRVEDGYRKDWGGNDNRKGDDFVVHMDELVQMTLYYFDKLFYNHLIED